MDFCSIYKLPWLKPDTVNLQRFVSWCFSFSKASEGTVGNRLTAIVNCWKINGLNYDRRSFPILRLQLNGYKRLRPSKKLIRKPFTIAMMKMAWIQLKDDNFYNDLIKAALCIGYWHGARVGEYATTPAGIKHGDTPLKLSRLRFLPVHGIPKEVTVTFVKSKSNQFGERTEMISSVCRCPLPCSPCSLKNLIRRKRHMTGFYENEFLLLDSKRIMLSPNNINNIIKNLVNKMKLNGSHYKSHSLRKGRTCDMVKEGFSKIQIKKFGRWRSDIWEEAYADFDFTDLGIILNTPISQLGYCMK